MLKAMGHKPPVRGGNGTGLARPQEILLDALSPKGWVAEYVVTTGVKREKGSLPTHYKIDLANPTKMVAIEVDGRSHNTLARREADKRKDAFLLSKGWSVFRVRNETILNDIKGALAFVEQVRAI